ncbi:uncharacterized protein SPPG_07420 [Spizellomyces punctatus DAOM BR117]|uniref:Uncharacterized protein n=1 Tax=Spizellomyces punctatus (strain DAOM BR117) TaxID=645134 RepID=A0A0L0H7I6_SPIPD|nr:uncharacterized protein SPPG_07420 [Spizellomyces punctatus DAOM BR117]KNC97505.1 hypothetical protein SPPG_07420 [Spizellomyces punctatus DAOM BR117]|eukprot:XP_016605545.1 hypothetical protein SPPG_07420 [Spizellomyces punctatus DAOM BR117]
MTAPENQKRPPPPAKALSDHLLKTADFLDTFAAQLVGKSTKAFKGEREAIIQDMRKRGQDLSGDGHPEESDYPPAPSEDDEAEETGGSMSDVEDNGAADEAVSDTMDEDEEHEEDDDEHDDQ